MTLRILTKRRRLREKAFWRKGRSIRTDWRESGALATFARDGFFCWARGENSVSDFCTACRFEFRSRRPLSQLKKGAGTPGLVLQNVKAIVSKSKPTHFGNNKNTFKTTRFTVLLKILP